MEDERPDINQQGIVYGHHAPEKRGEALRMRHHMTPAEALLWEQLRADKLGGLHFRRQQIIDGVIADFYCHAAALVVECDGPIHERQQEHDADRDAILHARGLLVLRFTNDSIERDLDGVLSRILQVATERKPVIDNEHTP